MPAKTLAGMQVQTLQVEQVQGFAFPLQIAFDYYLNHIGNDIELVNSVLPTVKADFPLAEIVQVALIRWNEFISKGNARLSSLLDGHRLQQKSEGTTREIFRELNSTYRVNYSYSGAIYRIIRSAANTGGVGGKQAWKPDEDHHDRRRDGLILAPIALHECVRSSEAEQVLSIDELAWGKATGFPMLTQPIHPIFCRGNFALTIDYDALKPTLRLASCMIYSSLPFLHKLIFGKVVPQSRVGSATRGHVRVGAPVECSTSPKELEKTQTALLALSQAVFFCVVRSDEINRPTGQTWPRMAAEVVFPPLRVHGCFSKIEIDERHYKEACIDTTQTRGNSSRFQVHSFSLAKTLFHELMHAAALAAHPEKKANELLHHGCSTSEEGFEGEVSLFGARLLCRNNVINVIQWPDKLTVDFYNSRDWSSIAVREGVHTHNERPGWVPPEFATQLFYDAFWETQLKSGFKPLGEWHVFEHPDTKAPILWFKCFPGYADRIF